MIAWVVAYGVVALMSFVMTIVFWKSDSDASIAWVISYLGWMLALIEILKRMEGT